MSNKLEKTKARREFLLGFFTKPDIYEYKEINGFIVLKYWDGGNKRWAASVMTPQSFENMQTRTKPQKETLF